MKKKVVNEKDFRFLYKPKIKIAISGAAETTCCATQAFDKSEELGKVLAEKDVITITGATTGAPYWVAKAAKMSGGIVVGMSPASSEAAHLKSYRLPVDYHDFIVYTGFDYAGRNLLLTRSADAVIIICGRIGTLNEFTIAFEDDKPIGVLTGTGGIAEELQEIVKKANRGPGKVIYDSDPKKIVEKLIKIIGEEKNKKREHGSDE
ncbi:MAG: hypothetical protein PHZ25_02940 [Candidatus Pacebacteria bacterium]|nr:hypothetical protein [Candidatus Paceibacterota bacterium]